MATSPDGAARKKKMIALHGKGGDATSFSRYLRPLVDATGHEWAWSFLDGPHDLEGGGRAWWKLPPGVRTFEAASLEGIEDSLALLDSAWPFEGILGFSQGAMLAAISCGRGVRGGSRPAVAIIAGAAFPACRAQDMMQLKAIDVDPLNPLIRSVHTVGARDEINPPEQARKVADVFGSGAVLLEHPGGHKMPLDDRALAIYADVMGVKL